MMGLDGRQMAQAALAAAYGHCVTIRTYFVGSTGFVWVRLEAGLVASP